MPQTDNSAGGGVMECEFREKFPEQDATFILWNQMPTMTPQPRCGLTPSETITSKYDSRFF